MPKPRPKPLEPKYFVDAQGNYLGAFSGIQYNPDDPATIEQPLPDDPNAVEVPSPPTARWVKWNGTIWVPQPPPPRDFDAEFAQLPDWQRAVIELTPGGLAAVKGKLQQP